MILVRTPPRGTVTSDAPALRRRRAAMPAAAVFAPLALAVAAVLAGCEQPAPPPPPAEPPPEPEAVEAVPEEPRVPESIEGKVSYGQGYELGKRFARPDDADRDTAAWLQGFADAFEGRETLVDPLTYAEARTALLEVQARRQAELESENDDAASAFLARNGARAEVITTASGLQYEVLAEGDGPAVTSTESVVVTHYVGRLLDGTEFDSSRARGQPATFGVGRVIAGWQEALQLMQVGDRWRLWIPGALAYGEAGRPGIPPNALLDFEVELLEVENP